MTPYKPSPSDLRLIRALDATPEETPSYLVRLMLYGEELVVVRVFLPEASGEPYHTNIPKTARPKNARVFYDRERHLIQYAALAAITRDRRKKLGTKFRAVIDDENNVAFERVL